MSKIKNALIKVLAVVFAVCVSMVAVTYLNLNKVSASTTGKFEMSLGASLRYPTQADEVINGVEKYYTGLRFQTEVDKAFFGDTDASDWQFGTLIFPANNGSHDPKATIAANADALDAVVIRANANDVYQAGVYNASVVFDGDYVKELLFNSGLSSEDDPQLQAKVEKVLNKFYDMEMSAVSFAVYNGEVQYTDSYSTTVRKVAARLALDPDWSDAASTFLGDTVVAETQKVYSTDRTLTVESVNLENITKIVANNAVVDPSNYSIQGGKIVFTEEFFLESRGEKIFYLFDAENNLSVVTAHLGDIIITTPEEFLAALDVNVRAPQLASNEYLTVEDYIVLANDLDMTGYTFMATVGKGMLFKGYFEGCGHVISNLTVKGYAGNSRAGGVFGSLMGFAKNVAFINLMGTGGRGLQSGALGTGFPWDGLTTDNNVENVYVQTSADILKYFSAAGFSKFDYRAKVINYVVETPTNDLVIDETWMKEIDEYSGKGLITLQQTLFQYKTNNFNNVYFVSENPIMYKHASGAVNINSLGEKVDYFVYGENETDVHFNFKYFETQLGAGVKPTVENTIVYQANGQTPVYDEKASKTFVLNNFRRYDDYASLAGDNSEKHLQNLAEMKATGMWTIINNAPVFKSVYERHHDAIFSANVTVNGEVTNSVDAVIDESFTIGVECSDAKVEIVSIEANNDNVTINGNQFTGVKAGESVITVTYKVGKFVKALTLNVTVEKQSIKIQDAIDYDAKSEKLLTNIFNGKTINKVIVNGEELTVGNGLTVDENGFTINAKTSTSDTALGIPFIDNRKTTPSQVFELTVETDTEVYELTNVYYWTIIVNNADEFVQAFTYDYGKIEGTTNIYVQDLIKIGNNIDLLVDGEYKQSAVTFTGTANANHYYAGSQNGFAGIVEGAGNVINNFKPSQYGLLGYIGNYGNNHISESAIRNIAFTNVLATSGIAVFAHGMYYNCTAPFALENVYVQVSSSSLMTEGLINIPSGQFVMNNVFVDYAKDKVVAPTGMKFDKDYSAADGKTYIAYNNVQWNAATCDAGALFSSLRRADVFNANVTNVYVASAFPIAWQSFNSGAYRTGFFKVDTTTNTLILQNNGYAGGAKSNTEYYYGYASNETVGTIPVIKEMKESFASVVNTAQYINNSMAGNGLFCNKCEEFTLVGADGAAANGACTLTDGCTGKYAAANSSGNAFGNVRSYIWTFHDLGEGYTNQAISGTNGVWKFDGIKKYDNVADMKNAGNDYSSFLGEDGNDCWTVVDGELTWVNVMLNKVETTVNSEKVDDSLDVILNTENEVAVNLDGSAVDAVSIATANESVVINENKFTATKVGSFELVITYTISGKNYTKTIVVNADHNYGSLVTAVAPDCEADGNVAHYKCSCCDVYYDENFEVIENVVIPMLGHAYPDAWSPVGDGTHKKVCANNNSHVLVNNCEFTLEVIDDKYLKATSTPTTKAQYYYSCECGAHGEEFFEYGEVAEVVDYDASTGKFITNALNGKVIEKVIVGEEELTVENGGIIVTDGVYTFRAKTSASDNEPGITFASLATIGQYINVKFVTADETIEFRFVSVWSTIIDDADEFLQTLDNNVFGNGTTKNVTIEKNIKLANDIDMAGKVFDNTMGTVFKGYFEGAGNVVSNIAVKGYNINNGNGGLFGSLKGYVKNVAFFNLMGAGNRGLYSGPLASTIEYDCLKATANVENVYIKASENLLNYFNGAGIGRVHTQAQLVNFVVELPTEQPVIDETWMKQGTDWTGKGSLFAGSSSLITNGPHGKNNIYVISKTPVLYVKSSSTTPNVNSLGAYTDYFMYGENETKVHFNFTYFETQLGAGVEPTVQNTQVYKADGITKVTDEKASKTHIVNGIRRYDDYAAFANDNSEKHLANLAAMEATGMWTIIDNAPVFTGVYERHHGAFYNSTLTVDGEKATSAEMEVYDSITVDFVSNDSKATFVKLEASNDNVTIDGKEVTAVKIGESVVTLTYAVGNIEHKLSLNLVINKMNVTLKDVLDYDAKSGALVTKVFDGKVISRATVNGEELTIENGGIILNEGAYTFRAKTSTTDEVAGVPFIDNRKATPSQALEFVVETEDAIYTFNATYWTYIVNDADEFVEAFSHEYGAIIGTSNIYKFDLIKLGNDIDLLVEEDGAQVYKQNAVTFTGASSNMYTNGSQNGFAGIVEGAGNVINNFKVNTNGLFGILSNYGSNLIKECRVQNIAFTNVDPTNAPIFANCCYGYTSNPIYLENIYIHVNPEKHMYAGIISSPNVKLNINNLFIDYAKAKVAAPALMEFDADYSAEDGKTYLGRNYWVDGTKNTGATLFNTLTAVEKTDELINNVYIASAYPVAMNTVNSGAAAGTYFKLDSEGKYYVTPHGTQSGKSNRNVTYGYASNETRGTLPVIKEMRPGFADLANANTGSNSLKGCYCTTCGKFMLGGTANTVCELTENCTGKLKSHYNLFAGEYSYIWTFHDLVGHVNQPISATNGLWKFSGVKRYDSVSDMPTGEVEYASFIGDAGNGCWTLVEGKLTWAKLANA